MILDKNIINIEYLKTLDWEIISISERGKGYEYGVKCTIKNENKNFEYVIYYGIWDNKLDFSIGKIYGNKRIVECTFSLEYEVGSNKELELFLKDKYIEAYKNALNKLDNEDKELLDNILLKDTL